MYLPKNRKSSIGVMKIPERLLMTAFHRAVATLPLAAVVRITHMLTVVGRQVRIRSPSRSGGLSRLGRNFSRNAVMGRPTSRGHKPNVVNSTEAFSLWFDAACWSSESSKDRPDKRKIHATPNFPMNNSALKRPPLFPNYRGDLLSAEVSHVDNRYDRSLTAGNARARPTATNIPNKKKFLLENWRHFCSSDGADFSEFAPPRSSVLGFLES